MYSIAGRYLATGIDMPKELLLTFNLLKLKLSLSFPLLVVVDLSLSLSLAVSPDSISVCVYIIFIATKTRAPTMLRNGCCFFSETRSCRLQVSLLPVLLYSSKPRRRQQKQVKYTVENLSYAFASIRCNERTTDRLTD